MLIHTAEEKETRRKLAAAMMAQNRTRKLKHSEIDDNNSEKIFCAQITKLRDVKVTVRK